MRGVLSNKDESLLFGYIDYDISENNKTVFICDFLIYEACRGKGYGKYLLTCFYNHIIEKYKEIKKIILIDCTTRYRQKDNIYLKFGFKYVNKYEPDMKLKINYTKEINDTKEIIAYF